MNVLSTKLKETTLSVVLIAVVVLLLYPTLAPLPSMILSCFVLDVITVILGLSLFSLGTDVDIIPLGRVIAKQVVKSGRFTMVMGVMFVLGSLLTMAEPDTLIYVAQIDNSTGGVVSSLLLMVVVPLGLVMILCVGIMRILRMQWLKTVLVLVYGSVMASALVAPAEYLTIAFDAFGVITGPLTVPVVLVLAARVAAIKHDVHSGQGAAFGLVVIVCVGTVVAFQSTTIVLPLGDLPASVPAVRPGTTRIAESPLVHLPHKAQTVFPTLIPPMASFLAGGMASFRLPRATRAWTLNGIVVTFLGLTLLLAGANGGFMDVDCLVGSQLAEHEHSAMLLGVAFTLGLLAVLAEPIVHVLIE